MSLPRTESVWPGVRRDEFRWRPRGQRIDALLWHITGSGHPENPARTEYLGTKRWFTHTDNRVRDPQYPDYAGMAHLLAGPDGVCLVVDPEVAIPAFSSHPSDEHVLSVEVALPTVTALAGEVDAAPLIANCVTVARWAQDTYGIDISRRERPYLDAISDWQWTGMAGHYDTKQGRASGHVDPGEQFWAALLAALEEEEAMTDDEKTVIFGGYVLRVSEGNIEAARKVLGHQVQLGEGYTLNGQQGYDYAMAQEMRLFRGIQIVQGEG